ncbi:precorrin-6Y C5,15-methyltransferase (decarboxylating) subunit CbiT [Candidatus Nitrosocosmicus franklandus]|uniref:Probable cobalt-precorrin-6B C(15)-methyltransferase (decarboxylating) n=1 Tax=Candidatus Nitrosocosmicus franklandianus TaxID=1798806 RepID=A0A484I9C0_9ARCH|nr:precorrin-6Y C5,15-methyltransferase (decarboxylating) subunit CbiT [Candidatus Nitrosocosmicus franklandus]VFJ13706.1 putative cobalt-precorrin-6B C(15)-methyltransferase (decarboxylating) [Candidatus Nitrosocosmicus franklandus]
MTWNYKTPGIPDELFDRTENVPITKEDIRSIIISKLRLREGITAIDIGCGSGSITVEISLQTRAKVFAIDSDMDAINLTEKNLTKFGVLNNAVIIHGRAQDVLPTLPMVEAIVIGGTTGETDRIVKLALSKLNKGGRLVLTSILIETIYNALKAMQESNLQDIDITQVTIAKSKKTSSGTMMISRNPVIIFSGTK